MTTPTVTRTNCAGAQLTGPQTHVTMVMIGETELTNVCACDDVTVDRGGEFAQGACFGLVSLQILT